MHYEVPQVREGHSGEWAQNPRRKLAEPYLHATSAMKSVRLKKVRLESDAYTQMINECSEAIPFKHC